MKIVRITHEQQRLEPRPGQACVVRYGGIGDILQASSLFPGLREQGWGVSVNTDETGEVLLRNDPHVDELIVQKQGFIKDLEPYWERLGSAFGRFINLIGSIEGNLLDHPSRPEYYTDTWDARHQRCNVNYLEHIHSVAGVPEPFMARFHATEKERRWARRKRLVFGPTVLISLSGSSLHKAYPYWDKVIRKLLDESSATVVLIGDDICRILEVGWQKYRRVKCRSGQWPIRKALAFAEKADVVVGTETGVMNAVGLLEVPKVTLLSHSSAENLTKHWRNNITVTPFLATCHPCHKLHLHSRTCRRDPHGGRGAWCAHSVDPARLWRPALAQLEKAA